MISLSMGLNQGFSNIAVEVSARAAVSSEGSSGEGSAFKFTHMLVAGLSSSLAIVWRHQFLAMWASV